MKILYVGDVMGEIGVEVLEATLPRLRREHQIDLIVAQAENVTEGKGISLADFQRLRNTGVDFCTGGNWSLYQPDIIQALNDPAQPIVRPANYPADTPGLGYKTVEIKGVTFLVISLLGQIVGRDSDKPVDNPLQIIDEILKAQDLSQYEGIVVNLHGDFSSEKVVIGHYLDGRATLVVGDHWHVPTADARVLPGGTAHITDVGMCGVLDASLGITFESVLPRWRDGQQTRNVLATKGPRQFNAVLVETAENGLAQSVELVREITPGN
jgi:metallophosphoesterase (TIGR00282 family)